MMYNWQDNDFNKIKIQGRRYHIIEGDLKLTKNTSNCWGPNLIYYVGVMSMYI